jgi:hypothetical protein
MPKAIPAQALFDACKAGDAAAVSKLVPAGGTPLNLSAPAFQAGACTRPLLIST